MDLHGIINELFGDIKKIFFFSGVLALGTTRA